MPSVGAGPLALAPSCAMNHACAPPMSELYQAPNAPSQSDMMPIRIAFDGAAALDVDVVLLLLPPQAATHRPHMATAAINGNRASSLGLSCLSNLVTSSGTFVIARTATPFPCSHQASCTSELDEPSAVDTPVCLGTASSARPASGAAGGDPPSRGPTRVRSLCQIPIRPSGDSSTISRKTIPMIVLNCPGPSQLPTVGVHEREYHSINV